MNNAIYDSDYIDYVIDEINQNIAALYKAIIRMDCVQASSVLGAYMDNICIHFDEEIKHDSTVLALSYNDKHRLLKAYLGMGHEYPYIEEIVKMYGLNNYHDLFRIFGLVHGVGTWVNNMKSLLSSDKISPKDVICYREDVYEYFLNLGMDSHKAFLFSERIRKGTGYKLNDSETEILRAYKVPAWYIDACTKISYLPSRMIGEKDCWIIWRLLYINYMDFGKYIN